MARLASRRRSPRGAAPIPAEPPPGTVVGAHPAAESYVRSVIEFLDKRWTRAEADLGTALRSLLLLCGTTILCAVLAASVAVAAAGAAFLIISAQDRLLGPSPAPSGLALLGAAGLGLLLLLLRTRAGNLQRRRPRGR